MKYIYLAVALCCIFSCSYRHKILEASDQALKEANVAYSKHRLLMNFPDSLIDHFPTKITSLPVREYQNYDEKSQCLYYILFADNANLREIDSLQNILKLQNKVGYNVSDSNLIFIRKKGYRKKTTKKTLQSLEKKEIYNIIPFFEKDQLMNKEDIVLTEDVYSDTTISGLSEQFVIYILNSEKGKYNLNMPPLDYMPEGWGNGYSKGICINRRKNVIGYWTLLW